MTKLIIYQILNNIIVDSFRKRKNILNTLLESYLGTLLLVLPETIFPIFH